ncbi:hypothetical protein CLOM621_06571 [Clostridium sp. M62/1]|nr:hypothetical protein CLOM621_06571 [Clostridium sp. M62/1]
MLLFNSVHLFLPIIAHEKGPCKTGQRTSHPPPKPFFPFLPGEQLRKSIRKKEGFQ